MPWGNDDDSSEDEIAPKTPKALMSQDNDVQVFEKKMDALVTSNTTLNKTNNNDNIADKLEGPPYIMLIKNLDYEINDKSLNTWLNEIGIRGLQGEAKVEVNNNNLSDGNGSFTVGTIEDVEHAMTFHKKSFRGRSVRIFPKTKGGKPLNVREAGDRGAKDRRRENRNDRNDRDKGRAKGNRNDRDYKRDGSDKTFDSYNKGDHNDRNDRKGNRGDRREREPLPPPEFDSERPKLNIIPASGLGLPTTTTTTDSSPRNSSIFGTGKPRDSSKDDFSKPTIMVATKEKETDIKKNSKIDSSSNETNINKTKTTTSTAPIISGSSTKERSGSISSKTSKTSKTSRGSNGRWNSSNTTNVQDKKDFKNKDKKVSHYVQ